MEEAQGSHRLQHRLRSFIIQGASGPRNSQQAFQGEWQSWKKVSRQFESCMLNFLLRLSVIEEGVPNVMEEGEMSQNSTAGTGSRQTPARQANESGSSGSQPDLSSYFGGASATKSEKSASEEQKSSFFDQIPEEPKQQQQESVLQSCNASKIDLERYVRNH